jgi:acetyl-CoA acetyltransferase
VLADRAWADKRGLAPTARLVSYGIAAVEPGMFGTCARGQAGLAACRLGHSIR